MTRGQIAIITPEGKILTSTEFNGNMYYEGYGKDVYDELAAIETVEEYGNFIKSFNDENFVYDEELFYEIPLTYFNMQDDYFGKWFSDYVYIKNLSEKPVVFVDANGKKIQLDTETTAVFNYGEFVACSAEDFEKKNFIEQLNEKKENLSYDANKNYSDIWNMCADYDNAHSGSCLTDRITEHDFVDEEVLEYIVKENVTDLCRLRCFIGDTYDADMYRLDGYGNLENVDKDDFESLLDDLVYDIENEICIPLAKKEACL